ncbi:MAG: hypothetical protein A2X86_20770 [Bdellovibrionales bacterium GWA2_49_15]|nr:MAG: hypothetical protein A2X86_20770 [Bdellovibrionales bacterium GWA2_49_15]HAZ13168.1 hypothetical protein [Bdellovibrionales bacterium]
MVKSKKKEGNVTREKEATPVKKAPEEKNYFTKKGDSIEEEKEIEDEEESYFAKELDSAEEDEEDDDESSYLSIKDLPEEDESKESEVHP